MAWWGSAHAAGQVRPRVVFTGGGIVASREAPTGDNSIRDHTATITIAIAPSTSTCLNHRRWWRARWRPGWKKPNRRGQRISSHRHWISNPFGGEGRRSWGTSFALVCGDGNHQWRPGFTGDGDLGHSRGLGWESRGVRGLDWVGLTDPGPDRLCWTQPGGLG
jgi:hypothetical protein